MLGSSWQSGWRRTCTPQLENKMHHGKWRDSKPKPAQTTKEKTNWKCRHQLRLEESPKSLSNINIGTKPRISKQLCAFQHFLLQMTLGEAILGFPTNSPNESLRKSHILGGKAWILSQKTINCSSYLGFLEPSGRGAKLKPQ